MPELILKAVVHHCVAGLLPGNLIARSLKSSVVVVIIISPNKIVGRVVLRKGVGCSGEFSSLLPPHASMTPSASNQLHQLPSEQEVHIMASIFNR
jgi:hypothetical protein